MLAIVKIINRYFGLELKFGSGIIGGIHVCSI